MVKIGSLFITVLVTVAINAQGNHTSNFIFINFETDKLAHFDTKLFETRILIVPSLELLNSIKGRLFTPQEGGGYADKIPTTRIINGVSVPLGKPYTQCM